MTRPQAGNTEPATTMANELLTQTEAETRSGADPREGHELDALLGKAFEEKPIWTGLYESIRDVFFPVKLPPLELTSTPIPVPDRMKVKANPVAVGSAARQSAHPDCGLLFRRPHHPRQGHQASGECDSDRCRCLPAERPDRR